MSSAYTAFNLKGIKQKLTRHLNGLVGLIAEAEEYQTPWQFPTALKEMQQFLATKTLIIEELYGKLERQKESTWNLYQENISSLTRMLMETKGTDGKEVMEDFDEYWKSKNGENIVEEAERQLRVLEKRLIEIKCQDISVKQEMGLESSHVGRSAESQGTATIPTNAVTGLVDPSLQNQETHQRLGNLWQSLDRRLIGNELKIPEFNGKASDFDSFWELFEELVDKQPYSNIEKFSILINCCTGDAARAIQMIPRTGASYAKAVDQLKRQYKDPHRVTMEMIGKLKSMRPSRDDPRSLRNTLNDVQAVIATLRRQGEIVDTTHMISLVTETFSHKVQKEIATKEFDSGRHWKMDELLENLTTIIKRREFMETRRETSRVDEVSTFYTRTGNTIRCVGCNQNHKFHECRKYRTPQQKVDRMKTLNVCWKCFSANHRTRACSQNPCPRCGRHHHPILCQQDRRVAEPRSYLPERIPSRSFRAHHRSSSPELGRGNTPQHRQLGDGRPRRATSGSPCRSPPRHFDTKQVPEKGKQSYRSPPPRSRKESRAVRFSRSPTFARNFVHNVQTEQGNLDLGNIILYNENGRENSTSRLMTAPVHVRNEETKEIELAYALLDSASDRSFVAASLVSRLKLTPISEKLITVTTFGGKAETKHVTRVNLTLVTPEGETVSVSLLTHERITSTMETSNIPDIDIEILRNYYPDSMSSLLTGKQFQPEILLGIDYFYDVVKIDEPILRLPSGLFVTPTIFGPVISGAHQQEQEHCEAFNEIATKISFPREENKNEDYSYLWKLQNVGIYDSGNEEEEQKQIIDHFYSNVEIRDEKIYVKFPWKDNKKDLADNYSLALSRLHQLFKMSMNNPTSWKSYCEIIDDQLRKDFVEDAPEIPNGKNPCYYIPHQAVIKESSETTKIRIVLDASSKRKGELSLNDVIHQGPLLLPDLCGILLRSRIGSKVMVADVEKAFHMIHLNESERDSVRFLWLKDTNKPPSPENIRILRFCRLPFGVNASPFLLGISIQYGIARQKKFSKEIYEELKRNLYVDNVMMTDTTTDSLYRKYEACKETFSRLSMNLRQFMTNDKQCNQAISEADLAKSKSHKILGIPWLPSEDTLTIKCKIKYKENPSKRKILQSAHSTFDPLGLLVPLILPVKVFLQDLWKANYEWDDRISCHHDEEWKQITGNIDGYEVTLPRAITPNTSNNIYELHTFVDASERSYAAVTYLRRIDESSTCHSSIVMARHRLAPLKEKGKHLTIPRLELLALLIGIRLTSFILKEISLHIESIRIYSDSQVTLHWLQSRSKNGTFIDNRCREIRRNLETWKENGTSVHLHYIPSHHNPADCATRGLTKEQLTDHVWWQGPEFLAQPTSKWPEMPEFKWSENLSAKENEEGAPPLEKVHLTSSKTATPSNMDALFRRQYSSFNQCRRVAAVVLKFIKRKIYNKVSRGNQSRLEETIPELSIDTSSLPLSTIRAQDADVAEKLVIRLMQRQISSEQFKKWKELNLSKDENGIVRCKGRIRTKYLPRETLEPILVLPSHPLTALIIQETHKRCGHQGVNGTLANIRVKFWIPKGRQVVKQCINRCIICKRWNGKPYLYPESPPLPKSRVEPCRAFSNIGIDLAGPFEIIDTGKEKHKRWICLATCMVTRGVHLEIVNNLGALQLINCLRRIIARRGKPKTILSDNATNLKMGQEIIAAIDNNTSIGSETLNYFLTRETITWKFITPLSPWKGGFYERIIGVMKAALRKSVGKRILNENDFYTLVVECEAMVNSRPLTYVGSTLDDSLVLRPIDFLIPHANVTLISPTAEMSLENSEDKEFFPNISTKEKAINYVEAIQSSLKQLWTAWTSNYLLELRNFHQTRINQKTFTRKHPRVGEIVFITDDDTPRRDWQLGLVTELIRDPDNAVRSVKVKTGKSTIERSVNMLIPLELDNHDKENEKEAPNFSKSDEKQQNKGNDPLTSENTICESSGQRPLDTTKRTRAFLPREAKKNITYANHASTYRSRSTSAPPTLNGWKYCIMAAILVNCLCTAQPKGNDTKILCIKGGVQVRLDKETKEIEVCGNDHCMEIKQPAKQIMLQFPPEVILHTYQVSVKTLQGNITDYSHWACPPSPFCEQINCNFCSVMIANPECWPRLAIGITAIIIYVAVITSFLLFALSRKIGRVLVNVSGKLVRGGKNMLSCIRNVCGMKDDRTDYVPLVEIGNRRRRKWAASNIVRILAILSSIHFAYACQQVVIIPSEISQCYSSDGNCSIHKNIVAKLNPLQPELCLKLQYGNKIHHALKVTLKETVLRCKQETLYYTRNTEVKVQYQKRCPHMGSCIGNKCAEVKPETLVKELEAANNFTGITYCSESCGGLGCSCGFPSSGCLFYRIYHVPIDEEIFEIFECSSWFTTIRLTFEEFQGNSNPTKYDVEIKPHSLKRVGNTEIKITTVNTNPMAILTKRFISNGRYTAYLDGEDAFSYACSSHPRLVREIHDQCKVKDTCKCNPAEDMVNCYCFNNNVTEITKLSHILPLSIPNGIVKTEGTNKVPTIRTATATVEIALLFNSSVKTIGEDVKDFTCNIAVLSIRGCYKCLPGAISEIVCYSDLYNAMAQVSCDSQTFSLHCSPDGRTNVVKLFFNTAQVREQCEANCGKKLTFFKLETTLNYINGIQPFLQYIYTSGNTSEHTGDFLFALPDISHFIDVCKKYILYTSLILAMLAAASLITVTYLSTSSTAKATSMKRSFVAFPPIYIVFQIIHLFLHALHKLWCTITLFIIFFFNKCGK